MKTIVYHSGALGDFVTILPLIRIWRTHTNSSIELISRQPHGELALNAGLIDTFVNYESQIAASLFNEYIGAMAEAFVNKFTHAFLFACDDSVLVRNFKRHFKGSLFQQPPFPFLPVTCVGYHLELLGNCILKDDPVSAIPFVKVEKNSDTVLPSQVVLHPGSGSRKKNWPFSRFLQVAEILRQDGLSLCWVTGPAEEQYQFPLTDRVVDNASLSDLSILFSQCILFIGNDSGVTHLAAASGCKVLAIFGPSDPRVWAPLGRNNIEIIYKQIECSPCHLKNPDPSLSCKHECLEQINVSDIAAVAQKMV